MNEERFAEILNVLKLTDEDRVVFNVNMAVGKHALIIVDGDKWHAIVRRERGGIMQRRGVFKSEE